MYDARSRSLGLDSAPVALPFVGPASTPELQLPPAPPGTKRFNRSRDFPGRIDRQGTADNRRKSALRAWYVAADRRPSEPHMTTTPSVVETNHLHALPRLRTVVSKTGNRSSPATVQRLRSPRLYVSPYCPRFKIREKRRRYPIRALRQLRLPSKGPENVDSFKQDRPLYRWP
jgi:hypothetical protein